MKVDSKKPIPSKKTSGNTESDLYKEIGVKMREVIHKLRSK